MYPYFDHPFILHLIGGFLRFILLFGGAFFLLWYYIKHTKEKVQPAVFPEDQKIILPLKLQAYERFVLLLERIHPANLVMRVNSRPYLRAKGGRMLLPSPGICSKRSGCMWS